MKGILDWKRLHLIVLGGHGPRILRLSVPTWAIAACGGALLLPLLVLLALAPDYATLRQQRSQFDALQARIAEQQAFIDAFQSQLGGIVADVEDWRERHERLWEPLGPELGPGARPAPRAETSVGGGTALRHLEAPDSAVAIADDLDRLRRTVTDVGQNLRALERFMGRAGRVLSALPFQWPVRGAINSEFGRRESPWAAGSAEFHSGLDIAAKHGTRVIAPAAGTVVFAGRQADYGVTLVIDHGNDLQTLYGHLSRTAVAVGQKVERGQVVASTGNTGRSSGPHLHYEIQVKGQAVNPRRYLWD
jgi:murein DD-endopeptidase MepM/ murein hydrolase activator NlpD